MIKFRRQADATDLEAWLLYRCDTRLLHISPGARRRIIEAGELWIDSKNYAARVKGKPLSLRLQGVRTLAALASEPGELKSREDLAKEVWGSTRGLARRAP